MTVSSFGSFSGLILKLVPTPNSRGVGALHFLGEVRVHENREGTALISNTSSPPRIS